MGAKIVEKQSHLGFVWEFTLGKSLVFSPTRNLGTIPFGFQLTNNFFLLERCAIRKILLFSGLYRRLCLEKNK
jgi:hypothetical protein